MHFGSINNIYPSNLTVNIYGPVNAGVSPSVTTDITQAVHFNDGYYGDTAAEVFSRRCHAAQSMLQGYLMLCAVASNDELSPKDNNANIASALLNGGAYYADQLKHIVASPPPLAGKTIDEQILERTWCKFICEIVDCIRIVETTPSWLESGLGPGFLVPELKQQMCGHLAELKKIDAMLTAMQSLGQSNTFTQTDAVRVAPSLRHGTSRHPRFPRPSAARTTDVDNQRAKFVARVLAHAETQTTSINSSHVETQTRANEQKSSFAQTEKPAEVAVASFATQAGSSEMSEQSTQTGLRGSGFSRDIKTQTEKKKFENKGVETTRIPRTRLIQKGVQTESEEIQLLNVGWRALQEKIKVFSDEITACAGQRLGSGCLQNPAETLQDLDENYSQLFHFFKAKCADAKSSNEKRELWSTFSHHMLPCMEQIRSARSQLLASLLLTQFTEQDNNKKIAIERIVAILDMAVLLALESNSSIQVFKWEQDKGKASTLARWQSFFPKDEALQAMLMQQFRLGQFAYGWPKQDPADDPKAVQTEPLDMQEVNAVVNEIAAFVDLQNMAANQNCFINDLINKRGAFDDADQADIENIILHIWLPAVASVKLLAQKRQLERGDAHPPTEIEQFMNIFLRDARWGFERICSTLFDEKEAINDPVKKQMLEGFKKIAEPESFGMLADASLVQNLIEYKIKDMHSAFREENQEWLVEHTPLTLLVRCLDTDDFALNTIEEWTKLIANIKDAWRNAILTDGPNSSMAISCRDYLKQAKTFYTTVFRNNLSEEEEKKEFATLMAGLNFAAVESAFGLGAQDAKAVILIEKLAKQLGYSMA